MLLCQANRERSSDIQKIEHRCSMKFDFQHDGKRDRLLFNSRTKYCIFSQAGSLSFQPCSNEEWARSLRIVECCSTRPDQRDVRAILKAPWTRTISRLRSPSCKTEESVGVMISGRTMISHVLLRNSKFDKACFTYNFDEFSLLVNYWHRLKICWANDSICIHTWCISATYYAMTVSRCYYNKVFILCLYMYICKDKIMFIL